MPWWGEAMTLHSLSPSRAAAEAVPVSGQAVLPVQGAAGAHPAADQCGLQQVWIVVGPAGLLTNSHVLACVCVLASSQVAMTGRVRFGARSRGRSCIRWRAIRTSFMPLASTTHTGEYS